MVQEDDVSVDNRDEYFHSNASVRISDIQDFMMSQRSW